MAKDNNKEGIKMSRSSLAIALSKLKGFKTPKVWAEQYLTDSETAASMLWKVYMDGSIAGKEIADLGAGTGILGLGAALLGAKKAFLVENDPETLEVCRENLGFLKSEGLMARGAKIVASDINDFHEKVDTVVENPPFGTKVRHADRDFLKKAFEIADNIYSLHKSESADFIKSFSTENQFILKEVIPFSYPLKATHKFHEKKIKRIEVSCFCFERKQQLSKT